MNMECIKLFFHLRNLLFVKINSARLIFPDIVCYFVFSLKNDRVIFKTCFVMRVIFIVKCFSMAYEKVQNKRC